MSEAPNESRKDARTLGLVMTSMKPEKLRVNVLMNTADSGISTIRLRYSSVKPRASSNPGNTLLLLEIDLVKHAAVCEVDLLRLLPAAEGLVDGEQVDLGELLVV